MGLRDGFLSTMTLVTALSIGALFFTGNMTFIQAVIVGIFTANLIHAIGAIFFQPLVINRFEQMIYDVPTNLITVLIKGYVLTFTGVNYYVQKRFIRLPFLMNKLMNAGFAFFLFIIWVLISVNMYEG
ncbi:hypothetical protein FZC66_17935 [Priestia megaterium]|nr:hypothetical protein FZC66_17935 [Priestia megaterium]